MGTPWLEICAELKCWKIFRNQVGDEFVGHAIGEILLIGIARQIL